MFCSTMQACQFSPFWLTGCTLHATTNNNWLSLPATLGHKPLKIKYIIIPWEDRYHGGSFKPFDMVCTNRLQLLGGAAIPCSSKEELLSRHCRQQWCLHIIYPPRLSHYYTNSAFLQFLRYKPVNYWLL